MSENEYLKIDLNLIRQDICLMNCLETCKKQQFIKTPLSQLPNVE